MGSLEQKKPRTQEDMNTKTHVIIRYKRAAKDKTHEE